MVGDKVVVSQPIREPRTRRQTLWHLEEGVVGLVLKGRGETILTGYGGVQTELRRSEAKRCC